MERFDVIEFEVLNCASKGMYIIKDGEHKDRAILLMKLGILKRNSVKNWHKSGWKFTDKGLKHFEEFVMAVREKHGHDWETDDGSINIFAYESGYHNGPKCTKCGFYFCHHCDSEFEIEKCSVDEQDDYGYTDQKNFD